MRAQGNQIQRVQVILGLLLALLLPLLFLIFGGGNRDSSEMDLNMHYAASGSTNGPENNIGEQMPPSKVEQNRQLDQRMYQFLELRKVE